MKQQEESHKGSHIAFYVTAETAILQIKYNLLFDAIFKNCMITIIC